MSGAFFHILKYLTNTVFGILRIKSLITDFFFLLSTGFLRISTIPLCVLSSSVGSPGFGFWTTIPLSIFFSSSSSSSSGSKSFPFLFKFNFVLFITFFLLFFTISSISSSGFWCLHILKYLINIPLSKLINNILRIIILRLLFLTTGLFLFGSPSIVTSKLFFNIISLEGTENSSSG